MVEESVQEVHLWIHKKTENSHNSILDNWIKYDRNTSIFSITINFHRNYEKFLISFNPKLQIEG